LTTLSFSAKILEHATRARRAVATNLKELPMTKMSFVGRTSAAVTFALLVGSLTVPAAVAAAEPEADFTQFVNPFIATSDDDGQDGPGAFVPHGLATVTPLTNPRSHTGYDYNSTKIAGFTGITLGGVGGNGAGGDFLVSPTYQTYTARPSTSGYFKDYAKSNEQAAPGYYQVGLTESGKTINAQATADTRTGVQDYTFENGGRASLVVDLANNFGTRQGATIATGTTADGNASLEGSLKGFFYNASYQMYYYAETTQPVAKVSTWGAGGLSSSKKTQDGTDIGAILSFDVASTDHVGLRYTFSTVSVEQAKRDMAVEVGGKSFADVKNAATAEWNDALGVVEVEEGADDDPTGDLKTQLYTHLFRMNASPINATSTDGTYRGADGVVYTADGYTHYDSWSLWDDFHKYSAIASIYPDDYRDIAQSLVDLFGQVSGTGKSLASLTHAVPTVRWERAAVVIADAINKGADLDGLDAAWPALATYSNGNYNSSNEALGFISGSVADTLGTAYDDWGMSVIATELGKSADAKRYLNRAANYVNLFNKNALMTNAQATASGTGVESVGLIMPRTASGFTAGVDPERFEVSGAGLYQGTLWQYNWYDAQDVGGMIELMGGKSNTKTALSYLFGEQAPDDCRRMLHMNTNEIDLHSPYLFNYVGAPSRTQYWTYSILTQPTCNRYLATGSTGEAPSGNGEWNTPSKLLTYKNSPKGFLPTMDNDAATMSSVFVSGALGLFPVTAGSDSFQITSPLFEKATIHYPGGKDFVINAQGINASNYFIQDATLNGSALDRTWLTFDEMTAGGSLTFDMGSTASEWGADSPLAYTMSDELSSSVYDKTAALATSTQVFEESAKNDGSSDTTITVTLAGGTFADASQVTAAGLPAGLAITATKKSATTVELSLTGKAAKHLLDDSTDSLAVTFAAGAFASGAPADATVALKVRFTGYGVTPSTTALQSAADGTVDTSVDLELSGGLTFADSIPAGSVSFPDLDRGVSAQVVKTGGTTATVTFSGALTKAGTSTFTVAFSDAAFAGGVSNVTISGPGASPIDPFTIGLPSTTRADLQALYDDARLVKRGRYSAASFTSLGDALATTKTVLADEASTEFVLAQTLAHLQSAVDGLAIAESGYRKIQAESFDLWSGGSLKTEGGGSGTVVAGVSPDSWIAFREPDLTAQALKSFTIGYSHNPGSASASSKVELRTGSQTGPLVTTIALPTTNGWANFTDLTYTFTSGELAKLSGLDDIYLVFRGTTDKAWVANVDYVQFTPVTTGTPAFEFAQLNANNVTSMHAGMGRDGAAGAYTNFGNTHNEEWIKFGAVNFGPNGADKLSFSYDKPTDKSTANSWIDIRLGSATGTTVASTPMLAFTGTGWNHYLTSSLAVDPTVFTGTQDVFIVFRMDKTHTSGAPYVANVAWFQFGDTTSSGATQKTVEFESRSASNGLLDANGSLASGTDFVNGNNGTGVDAQNHLKIEEASGRRYLAGVTDDAWVLYPNVALGANVATALQLTYDAPSTKVSKPRVSIYVDSLSSEPLVSTALPTTGTDWGTWTTTDVALPRELTGKHSLYVVFTSDASANAPYVGNFDSFSLVYGADKASLRAAIAEFAPLVDDRALYLPADFRVFTQSLAWATSLVDDPTASASSVSTAQRVLTISAEGLEWKVIRQLDDLIATAEAVREEDATVQSFAALQAALAAAKAVDSDATHEQYSSAFADLSEAYGALTDVYATMLFGPSAAVEPGAQFTVTGTGFAPNEVVTFSWSLGEEFTETADDAGEVSTTVAVPASADDDTYVLTAVGATSATPATESIVVLTVKTATVTTIIGAPTTAVEDESIEIVVGVTEGATGEVELFDGTTSLGTETLDGEWTATFAVDSLGVGAHSLSAVYAGDKRNLASTSGSATVTVTPKPEEPAELTITAPVLSKASQAYSSIIERRATISASVTGADEGVVTFRSGSTVLGTAALVDGTATLRLPSKLAIKTYSKLTASVTTSDNRTVVSVASAAKFTVVKAKPRSISVSASKFAAGTKPTVTVRVGELSNGRMPSGQVKIYVSGKLVKAVSVTPAKKGKVTVTLPSRYWSSISVKATFVPLSPKYIDGRTSPTVKVTVKR
jgi:predicted alpha-1,2-mannosidase